jgi:hypothetical protein
MNPKYCYGQEVNYRHKDENGLWITDHCIVVGITVVESVDQSHALNYPAGTVIYTVEFGDGSDELVPEDELEVDSTGGPAR